MRERERGRERDRQTDRQRQIEGALASDLPDSCTRVCIKRVQHVQWRRGE